MLDAMDPNLQQLLWAGCPLACFWFGYYLYYAIENIDPKSLLGGLIGMGVVIGHLVAFGFMLHAVAKALHVVP